jgi:ribonuclease HI
MPDLEIRKWESIDRRAIKKATMVKLSEDTPSCGMGCDNRVRWGQIFKTSRTLRAIMSNDNYSCETTTRTVHEILQQNVPTTECKSMSMWEFLDKHRESIKDSTIYTDGAWKDTRKDEDILFSIETKERKASAAILIMSDSDKWKAKDIITITIKPRTINIIYQIKNAFTMEVTALLAAAQILNHFGITRDITSDCKSACDKLNYGYINNWENHGQDQLLKAIRTLRKEKVLWTRSHPEKRMEPNNYKKGDYGISLADAICNGDLRCENIDKRISTIIGEIEGQRLIWKKYLKRS